MVGRLTRRIYIYGLDGLVGIPENFVGLPLTICAKQSNCTQHPKNRHSSASSFSLLRVPSAPCCPTRCPVAKPPGTSPPFIQESNQPHQIFSGNVTFIGVTYPTVWLAHRRLPQLAPQSSAHKFSAEVRSLLALGLPIFMAASYCLRDAVKFQNRWGFFSI
jgi:hypothetical protein